MLQKSTSIEAQGSLTARATAKRDFRFNEETHTYTLDGEVIPSVTHIIRFLDVDVDKSRPWLRDVAAERGSIVHNLCALLDYGEPDVSEQTPPYIQPYITAYVNFLRDHKCQWEYIERPCWGQWKDLRYAGTIDRYGLVDSLPTLLDIKTGSSSSSHRHAAQLTGYQNFPEIDKDCRLAVLYLRRDGTYKFAPIKRDAVLWDACVTIHAKTGGKK